MDVTTNGPSTEAQQQALGAFIRARRMELHLTQTQLGNRTGWTQERISILENGKYGMPSLPALVRLATALECTLSHLLAAAGFAEDDVASARDTERSGAASFHTLQRLLAIPATSLKESLNQAADLISEVMTADKIDAMMYEPEIESLVALGTSNTPMGRRQHDIGMNRLPLANGGREVEVFQTGEPYHSGTAKADPGMLLGVTDGLGAQSVIAVPLDIAGTRRGVLMALNSRQDHFVADDLAFMILLARWVGMVAERAELAEHIAAEAVKQARRAAAEELMTVLAHDLNNHLTPVKGQIDLLRRRAQQEDRAQDLSSADTASRAITRMQQLIADLLDAARLEGGVFALSLAPVDLVALVRDVAERHGGSTQRIEVRLPDELTLQADASRLGQALENLLNNAVEHSPESTPITVTLSQETRADGVWAILEVRDEGPGIAADLLPTLFERFAKDTGSPGLGLGLYLARGVAHAHGGDLTVETQVGQGSTFRLSLPLGDGALTP
jgi:two-component system, OmpR family, sensor kinase